MPVVPIITNYQELLDAIGDWLDRKDLISVVPSFVQLCEADINRKLRVHKMVKSATARGVGNDGKIALPDDWLEMRNVEIDGTQALYQSPDVIDIMKQNETSNCGAATSENLCLFTYVDSCIELYPVPTIDYDIKLDYYARIPPLREEADYSNWILEENPDVYLYGSLAHAAPYLRDDPRIAVWMSTYDQALGLLDMASKRAMYSGSRLVRKPQVRLG